uniref:hypothetical protein n=1 Tax=uncultured Paraglaciecola sp. TaxID=1765024 RepID=UPI002618DF95
MPVDVFGVRAGTWLGEINLTTDDTPAAQLNDTINLSTGESYRAIATAPAGTGNVIDPAVWARDKANDYSKADEIFTGTFADAIALEDSPKMVAEVTDGVLTDVLVKVDVPGYPTGYQPLPPDTSDIPQSQVVGLTDALAADIAASRLTGVLADARVQESNVTQYVAAQYATVTTLLASTAGYVEDEIVSTQEEGYNYKVAASGASDHNLTTAGSVKLYVLPFEPNRYHVGAVGAVGSGDETAIVQTFVDQLPIGSELHFDGSKTYTFNIDTENAIYFAPNGATFVNAVDNDFILRIGSLQTVTSHAVTETLMPYGTETFTVTNADTLFAVGDIGTLHDGRVRPS